MTEEEVRRIVREELAAQREGIIFQALARMAQAIERVWGMSLGSNHPQPPSNHCDRVPESGRADA
ncbi:MAG: hypothetical protein WCG26_01400 [Chloroflexales bacterium]